MYLLLVVHTLSRVMSRVRTVSFSSLLPNLLEKSDTNAEILHNVSHVRPQPSLISENLSQFAFSVCESLRSLVS
jgi:hypothetical protein